MKRTFLYAMLLAVPVANAQVLPREWMNKRFGINAPAPNASMQVRWDQYKTRNYQEGSTTVRYNNSAGVMTANGYKEGTIPRSASDPLCRPWQDLYEITNMLPAGTWVRVSGNIGDHYPLPNSALFPVELDRMKIGIIDNIMFRGNSLDNSLNLLWNIMPVVWPHAAKADVWNNISVNAVGHTLSSPVAGQEPKNRDWYRPHPSYFSYLRQHTQNFVNQVNNYAARKSYSLAGGTSTFNFIERTGFQLGNEPAAGRPGGSSFSQVGSWEGLGNLMDSATAGLEYGPSANIVHALAIPNTFGTNPLSLPAFSYLGEGITLRESQMAGRVRAFQESGAITPGLNEIATYGKEVINRPWAAQCDRRSVHFRSPVLRWKFNNNDFGNVQSETDMNFYGPGDPVWGRWETPEEYARRWVKELEKVVDLIANLPMANNRTVVDVTECYLTGGESGLGFVDSVVKMPDGSTIDFKTKSLDEIRHIARHHTKVGNALVARSAAQIPPTKRELLIAIRQELYKRDTQSNDLTKNLGRIYLWGAYYADPRYESGIVADGTGNANYYHPYMDFRFNFDEVRAFFYEY
jgi:hypothetical protein